MLGPSQSTLINQPAYSVGFSLSLAFRVLSLSCSYTAVQASTQARPISQSLSFSAHTFCGLPHWFPCLLFDIGLGFRKLLFAIKLVLNCEIREVRESMGKCHIYKHIHLYAAVQLCHIAKNPTGSSLLHSNPQNKTLTKT